MDKIDGPYYFFKLIQKLRHALPEWFPLAGPEGANLNVVPVDFVAKAMDHIAHMDDDDLYGDTFHLVDPDPKTIGQTLNTFAKAAHAPAARDARRREPDEHRPQAGAGRAQGAAHRAGDPEPGPGRPGHPAGRAREPRLQVRLRRARHPARAARHRHRGPAARVLRGQAVGLLGAQPRPGPVPRALADQVDRGQEDPRHRRLERHRRRARPPDRRRGRRGHPGLAHAREARGDRQGGRGARRHRPRAPGRPVRPRGHRADGQGGARGARRRRHPGQQRRPLDPPLAGALVRPLPRLRAHDAAELLRRAEADHGLHARHARAQEGPHHQRVVDRRADQHAALLARTSRRSPRSTRSHAAWHRRWRTTTCRSRPSTCRSCARR